MFLICSLYIIIRLNFTGTYFSYKLNLDSFISSEVRGNKVNKTKLILHQPKKQKRQQEDEKL